MSMVGWAEPRLGDLTENYINLVERILGRRCEPTCRTPHVRSWRKAWFQTNLPGTTRLMPALTRELIGLTR